MLLRITWCILCVCTALVVSGQKITGIVKDAESREPLPFANVFIDNTTIGTTTDEKGFFMLANSLSTGPASLVISFVGYQTFAVQVNLVANETVEINAALVPDKKQLSEIQVQASRDKTWEKLFKEFEKEFLGTSRNAKKSRILNPWVVDLTRNQNGVLEASASEPLEIENMALGYRITFFIIKFEESDDQYFLLGRTKFKKLMPLDEKQNQAWTNNRKDAYLGAEQHLFRSMIESKVNKEGFELYIETKPQEKIVRANLFRLELGTKVIPFTYVMAPTKSTIYRIALPRRLEVHYTNDLAHPFYRDISYRVFWVEAPQGFIEVNAKGVLSDPTAIRSSGYTRVLRVADMVPFDYDPAEGPFKLFQ